MKQVMMLSREVRRVPLDFDAPIGETRAPYLDVPAEFMFPACPTCGPVCRGYGSDGTGRPLGDGMTPASRQIHETWLALAVDDPRAREAYRWDNKLTQAEVDHLIAEGRLGTWVPGENGKRGRYEPLPRTAAEINAAALSGWIHDGINRSIAWRYRCELLGIETWCPSCGGHGDIATAEHRTAAEAWRPPEPPEGPGWQLWQTVSEGGPVSPVHATREELAAWLAENRGGHHPPGRELRYEEWLAVLDEDVWATEIGTGDPVGRRDDG